jgi:hypothetical protein
MPISSTLPFAWSRRSSLPLHHPRGRGDLLCQLASRRQSLQTFILGICGSLERAVTPMSRSVPPPLSSFSFPFPLPLLCPGHFNPSLLAALQTAGPEWSTPRSFHVAPYIQGCQTISVQHLSCTFPLVFPFSCGKLF